MREAKKRFILPQEAIAVSDRKPRTRLYTPEAGESPLRLDDERTLDVARVLRLQPGEPVVCFADGSDDFIYRVVGVKRSKLGLKLEKREPCQRNPVHPVALVQAIGKSGKADDVVKSATATGATLIYFVPSRRAIGRFDEDRKERLNTIAIETCRQCGRNALPEIRIADSGSVWQEEPSLPEPRLLADETGGPDLVDILSSGASSCSVAIGPEGGWDAEEREILLRAGWQPVSIGRRILRTELAATVALGVICSLLKS